MQYAQVVPNTKTDIKEAIFTYAIPAQILPQMRLGILVTIPFHGRNIQGIVVSIKKRLPQDLERYKVKKIINIVDPVPVVDQTHLKLAWWMSDYYAAPLGETLFTNLVPIAKRSLQTGSFPKITASKIPKKKKIKPILLLADFENRLKIYLKVIKQTLQRQQNIIILIPDLSLAKIFLRYLPDFEVSLIHSQQTLTERYQSWQKIRQGKSRIILGSNSALFAPVSNLGLIIIDQEENSAYKSKQQPRYHAVKVAEKLAQFTKCHFILGSASPRIETFWKAKKNFYYLVQIPSKTRIKNQIVDINNQPNILSLQLQEGIGNALLNKQKVVLFVHRKGQGRIFSCADCGYVFICPSCAIPRVPKKESLICTHCNSKISQPKICPKCQGPHLRPLGLTTSKVENEIKKIFPKARVIRVEKETFEEFKINHQTADLLVQQADIIVGTLYLTKIHFGKVALVGIILADQLFNLPDFRASERAFQKLSQILRLGKSGIIQTYIPKNPVFSALKLMSFEQFYTNEIKERLNHKLPPYSRIIRLIYQDPNRKKAFQKTHQLYQKLSKILPDQIRIEKGRPFFPKIRDLSRYQIVIFWPIWVKKRGLWKKIFSFIPSEWTIDVDPVDLL